MRIALFGATGMIGQRVLREAVQRGHDVTAIARDPSKIASQPHVYPAEANLLDRVSVATVAVNHDAVLSAFAPSGDQGPESLLVATRSLLSGLTVAAVRRLIVVGGAGSLLTESGTRIVDDPNFPPAWKPIAMAHANALDIYRNEGAGIDWTYISPAAVIGPGQRTGKFRLSNDHLVADASGQSRISAEDFAVAMLDELEQPKHIGQRFTVGY